MHSFAIENLAADKFSAVIFFRVKKLLLPLPLCFFVASFSFVPLFGFLLGAVLIAGHHV